VPAGSRRTINLPITQLYTQTRLHMPVHVVNGRRPGPRLFVCAAIHGDELNGVEIIRRVLRLKALNGLCGCLVAVPIVNVLGFISQSRYLADGRDLNRFFPGAETGSFASTLASLFMKEIVGRSTHGIDLHTGARHRSNFPQIRISDDDPAAFELAEAFGAPIIIPSSVRDGSLRDAVRVKKIPLLLYEAGEALRFDEVSIRIGVRGVLNVMRRLGMLKDKRKVGRGKTHPIRCSSSLWLRAPAGGIFRTKVPLGSAVRTGQVLGTVSDPFGENEQEIVAPKAGHVIGGMEKPLVNEGDALYHIASADEKELRTVDIIQTVAEMDSDSSQSASGETFQSELSGEPV
jgi:predicted deacylase